MKIDEAYFYTSDKKMLLPEKGDIVKINITPNRKRYLFHWIKITYVNLSTQTFLGYNINGVRNVQTHKFEQILRYR